MVMWEWDFGSHLSYLMLFLFRIFCQHSVGILEFTWQHSLEFGLGLYLAVLQRGIHLQLYPFYFGLFCSEWLHSFIIFNI